MINYMLETKGTTIHCTRGDVGNITFNVNNEKYRFVKDDVVTLTVYERGNVDNAVLKKNVEITEETTSVIIELTASDTKIGHVINKPVTYWYDISINGHAVICYDYNGPKEFILYPKGDGKQ